MGTSSRKTFDESFIEISKSQEALDISDTGGGLLVHYCGDLFRIHLNTLRGDHKAQERGFPTLEFVFLRFDKQSSFLQLSED